MTALTMSKIELRDRAERLVLRRRRRAGKNTVRPAAREVVLSAVRLWANEVYKRYPDVRIILFGSSVSVECWDGVRSDIDLAIAGMHGADYWQIWKLAEEMLSGLKVDLVDLEMATTSFRKVVESTGIKL